MKKENIPVISKYEEIMEKLYDKCENMEQLFDKYYLPLLDKHYSKTYELQQENQSLKEQVDYLRRSIERKEETIIELEHERVPYENKYVEELKKQLEELREENSRYERKNQKYKEVFDKVSSYIKLLGKYDGKRCTRGFSMMTADFNKLLDILKEVE